MYYYQTQPIVQQSLVQYPVGPRILISHSSRDKDFCNVFVEFLALLGFTHRTLIYTSKSGYGVPLSNDIFEYLRSNLENRKLWVFFMLSENFYNSPVCLNEMGAAWVRQNHYYSVLLPGFGHGDIEGVINRNKHTLDLCDPVRLTELTDTFRKIWQLPLNNTTCASIQQDFIDKIKPFYA